MPESLTHEAFGLAAVNPEVKAFLINLSSKAFVETRSPSSIGFAFFAGSRLAV